MWAEGRQKRSLSASKMRSNDQVVGTGTSFGRTKSPRAVPDTFDYREQRDLNYTGLIIGLSAAASSLRAPPSLPRAKPALSALRCPLPRRHHEARSSSHPCWKALLGLPSLYLPCSPGLDLFAVFSAMQRFTHGIGNRGRRRMDWTSFRRAFVGLARLGLSG